MNITTSLNPQEIVIPAGGTQQNAARKEKKKPPRINIMAANEVKQDIDIYNKHVVIKSDEDNLSQAQPQAQL